MSIRHCIVGLIVSVSVSAPLAAQTPDIEFFESKIRPVLAQKCYGCHNSKMPAPKGEPGARHQGRPAEGRRAGPAIVPGKPAESRLIKALSYGDPLAQMPPCGKLPDAVIADFEQWIARGAADPRTSAPALGVGDSRNTRACRSKRAASGGHFNRWLHGSPRQSGGVAKAGRQPDRLLHSREARSEENLQPSPQADRAHAGDACLCRSGRLQADLRRECRRSSTIGRRMPTRG